MSVYTLKDWEAAGTFRADPGQEIDQGVYEKMLNCTPPRQLPPEKAREALRAYNIPVHAGFLMGEPHSCDDQGRQYYLAFGVNDYGKGKHYYYLGLSRPVKRIADGVYYFMDCMNAFVNDGLFPASEFTGDADAIQTAANYEATLYKYEYQGGERIRSEVLYEPRYA